MIREIGSVTLLMGKFRGGRSREAMESSSKHLWSGFCISFYWIERPQNAKLVHG